MKLKQKWNRSNEGLQLKMLFLLVYNLKIVIYLGELTFGDGGQKFDEGDFFCRWGMSIFLAGGRNPPILP